MNQIKKTTTFSLEERKQFNVEMMKILKDYSKEEIETALHQINKTSNKRAPEVS